MYYIFVLRNTKKNIMNTAKQQLDFKTRIENVFVEKFGAIKTETIWPDHNIIVKTNIGNLYLIVSENNEDSFSVFGNFLNEPQKAKFIFGHWKQNIHSTLMIEKALEEVEAFYSNIINQVN